MPVRRAVAEADYGLEVHVEQLLVDGPAQLGFQGHVLEEAPARARVANPCPFTDDAETPAVRTL